MDRPDLSCLHYIMESGDDISVLVPDNRQSRLTLFVGDSVAGIVSLPRAAHFGVAAIGSSGELLLWNRYPNRSWFDIEEEWLGGHMTLFDTETGALDTVASLGRMNCQVSDARLEEIVQEDMSRYRAMIGQPLPLFGSPFADADGKVWLPSYRPAYPEEGSPYTVISPGGEWLGQVETPPRFRILDVTGGLVLGVIRDEMDVESVMVYGLVR